MADSAVFDFICGALEAGTPLDRLAVRGTVRIALKQAGLEARSVTRDQMSVVIDKILPVELVSRGVDDVDELCAALKSGLAGVSEKPDADTPDAVFERLGGR
jgi:hypothetical protein